MQRTASRSIENLQADWPVTQAELGFHASLFEAHGQLDTKTGSACFQQCAESTSFRSPVFRSASIGRAFI